MALFHFHQAQIEYHIIGTGHESILCFHGFGRSWQDFREFETLLLPHQRLVCISLFEHGESRLNLRHPEKNPMTRKQWCEILLALCKHLDINKFHLLGYSMGGRVAMTTAELLPQLTRSLFVLAPDGFYKNPIYLFASGTAPGRWLYRKMIYYPAPLFLLANVLHKLGLLSSKLHRFIHVHLDTPHKRMQVYRTWLLYRKMFPVLPNLALLIRQKQFDFHMIFGRYDSVITVRRGKKFCRILGSSDAMHVLDQGHRLLNEDTVKYINSNELWPGLQRQS